MRAFEVIRKAAGETPLAALGSYRARSGIPEDVPLTYAGRLDPMATGKLIVLIGEECKRKESYLGLDKEYVFELLFGFSTDTGDILGIADRCLEPRSVSAAQLKKAAQDMRGPRDVRYPAYSSKTVGGEPLFLRAREGRLPGELPSRSVHIYAVHLERVYTLASASIAHNIESRLAELHLDEGSANPYKDFRRAEVLDRWRELLRDGGEHQVARFRAAVSSGTYIRSLAPALAEGLGLCGVAYSIDRTRIGRYWPLIGNIGLWSTSL